MAKTANYREDATALLQSFSEDARLKFTVPDGSGRDGEAAFQLAAGSDPRQDRDGLQVDVDGEQVIGATLGLGSAIF